MRRFIAFFCIVSAAAIGAWALPAGHADSSVDSAGADAAPVPAPVVPDEPALSTASADRAVESLAVDDDPVVEAAPAPAEPPAADLAPAGDPDHLRGDQAAPAALPEPTQIVTTTTAPPTTTTAAPVVTIAFSAAQAYGSCDEPVPYDIFSGQATPGSTITISSPHGSGSTTADSSGHWERKVEFPSAPRGEAFSVSVSGLGGSKTFSFTATGGGSHA